MAKRRIATLSAGILIALVAALGAMSGAVLASNSAGGPVPVSRPASVASPALPSDPNVKCGGTVGFTGVPDGWYLIIEPGDHLYTSGFDSIPLDPGDYTYEFRDANANDQVGGTFTIGVCPTASPTQTAVESFQGETASPPPTGTIGDAPSSNQTPLFALLICLAFGALGLAAVVTQRRSFRR